ncbi:MAG: RDD family protein [Deltaproteobacteria bacterium]|nr:RDD family protein [Deltaproteobacteria bacterium]
MTRQSRKKDSTPSGKGKGEGKKPAPAAQAAASSEAPRSLAPHHLRLFAIMVDYLLAVVLLKIFEQTIMPAQWDLAMWDQGHDIHGDGNPWAWGAGLFTLLFLKDSLGGTSPGKLIAGLKVVRSEQPDQPPPFKRVVLRNLSLLVAPVDAVLVFIDPYFRRLGDRLAGTVVVVPADLSPPTRRMFILLILFLASLLATFLLARRNLFRTSAYQLAEQALLQSEAVRLVVGAPVEPGSDPDIQWPPEDLGEAATVKLQAEGPLGEVDVLVELRKIPGQKAWEVYEVRVEQKQEEEKPTDRQGAGSRPLEQKDAPSSR